jgi:hypothetical protein
MKVERARTIDSDEWQFNRAQPAPDVATLAQNLARTVGVAVFPVREDKRPATPHGFKDAEREPRAIAELWRLHPGPLIGVATGEASDLAVLDVDAKHDSARDWWQRHEHMLPPTRTYRTRGGGVHLYFRHAPGVRCATARPVLGIDVRGEGGYIVSWFAAGLPCLDQAPSAPWPDWLSKLIWPPRREAPRAVPETLPGDEHAIAGIVRTVRDAREGARNGLLFWGANRLRERCLAGGLTSGRAEVLLFEAARAAGLNVREIISTIDSAWRSA